MTESDDLLVTADAGSLRAGDSSKTQLPHRWTDEGVVVQTACGSLTLAGVSPQTATAATFRVVPAHQTSWEDLQIVFGARGQARRCQCQRYKLAEKESFGSFPVEERAHRLRQQTDCSNPSAGRSSGLVAYAGDEPAGWCAVEPRAAYLGLVRSGQVPWVGRSEDRADPTVWAITCLFTRTGFRRRGISKVLVDACVEHAQSHGARALEAYPITTTDVIPEELHVGLESVFAAAGFNVVSRPTTRRCVMQVLFG